MKVIRPFFPKYYVYNNRILSNALSPTVNSRYFFSQKFDFVEKTVQIQTCGHLYRNWKEKNIFWNVPEGDLIFNVPYIDTAFNFRSSFSQESSRTVLALHGAPGSWRDFKGLILYLHQCGYRVIAPSFPDFRICKPGIFRHSDVEKAQYIKDFLKAIFVSNVDHLVSHSGAVYTALNLCLSDNPPTVKSLTLLNPVTFNFKEMRFTKAFRFIKPFVKSSENSVLLKIMEEIGPFILKNMFKVPVRFESLLDPLLSATTLVYGHVCESKEKFLQIVQKLPLLYIFSENDPLIGAKCSYELAELLGAPSSDILIYNKEGVLVQQGKSTHMLKILAFQEGSHYVFFKHPEIVNREIANFLELQGNNP